MKLMSMPPLTYFLGPAVAEGNGTSTTRQLRRLEITRELLGNLPPASWQYVKCHGAVPDAIAFQERGFRAYVQFTHEIAPESPDVVWHRMRDKTRNVIRRAQERFATEQLMDPDEFVQLYERNLGLKNIHNGLESRICRTLIMASLRRGRGEIMVARDNNKNIVAANFCVWDRGSTFYVLSTRSGESGNGGISLLLWQAIRRSTERGLTFDFAGLGNQGSVLLYTGFGGVVRPRYVALRASGMARFIRDSRLLISAENCFY